MNTLVANVSTFSFNKDRKKYVVSVPDCDVQYIEAIHTNESILKCVTELTAVKSSGGIQKVLALVSNAVGQKVDATFEQTALDYYKGYVDKLAHGAIVIEIPLQLPSGEERDFAEILNDICLNIATNDVVFIDSAGGQRTHAHIIQLLTKVLRFTGIENPMSLYSDIQNTPRIVSTVEYDRMASLADGFNEFMTTGKSDKLNACLSESKESNYRALLQSMKEFSDKIRLSNVDALEETVDELKRNLFLCQQTKTDSIETVILNQFLPVFQRKLLGEQGQGIDYEKIISWCLENALIQQAATVYVEKLPGLLFKKELVELDDENLLRERFAKLKGYHVDIYSFAFYQELFTVTIEDNDAISLLAKWLQSGGGGKVDVRIQGACNIISSFFIREGRIMSNGKDAKTKKIKDFLNTGPKFKTIHKFRNALANNVPLLRILLDMSESQVTCGDFFAKKFEALESLKKGSAFNPHYRINVDSDSLRIFMYAYVYMKGVRNQMNHANEENSLTNQQKIILHTYGYDFSENSLEIVQKNIRIALEAFSSLRVDRQG